MFSNIFEEIGLSPNEAKIYETLLSEGEVGASDISTKAGVHRRNVYDTLNRLVEKGLVFKIFQKNENLFKAVNPEKLLEVLQAKENKLTEVLPKLQNLYQSQPKQEAAYIYKGKEGYKNYLRDMARVAEDTYFLGAKGLWFTPWVEKKYLEDYRLAMQAKNKKYFTLYDYRVKEKFPEIFKSVGGDYKILPKNYTPPGVTDVFGNYVVTFTSVDIGNVGEDVTIFIMENKLLAETFRTWFKIIWDFCPNIKK